MCALLDPEIKQWLDIGAQYLTAVGTVGAVIVALYLSRKIDWRRSRCRQQFIIHRDQSRRWLSPCDFTDLRLRTSVSRRHGAEPLLARRRISKKGALHSTTGAGAGLAHRTASEDSATR